MTLSWIQRPGFPGHFFALASGSLLPLSFAPYYLWPLGIISVALFYASIKSLPTKSAALRGWWFGLGTYTSGVSWVYISIHVYSNTPALLAFLMTFIFVAGLALFFMLMTLSYQKWMSKHGALGFAVVWVLFEWLRSWLLTGFPWLFLGDAYVDTWLKGWAPVFGVYSISLIAVLLATQIVDWNWKSRWKLGAALLIAPWLLGFGLKEISWTYPISNAKLNVVAIQGNIPQERKWLPEELYPTLEMYRQITDENWDADLILWPETAVTAFYHQAPGYLNSLNEDAQLHHSTVITGIPYQQSRDEPYPGAFHNSILALGQGSGIYHKQKLVPFGEYVPIPDSWRGLLEFFNIPMSDFRRGRENQPILTVQQYGIEYKVAPFICYEVVYPDFVRKMAKNAGFLITISNDAWFGSSNGPIQHMGIVRMRALENGKYMLRATNTGITALVAPDGTVVSQLPQFKRGVLKAEAEIRSGSTPFSTWGSTPLLVLLMLFIASVKLKNKFRREETKNA